VNLSQFNRNCFASYENITQFLNISVVIVAIYRCRQYNNAYTNGKRYVGLASNSTLGEDNRHHDVEVTTFLRGNVI